MESVFYKHRFSNRLPVTYLFLELFTKSIENSGSEDVVAVLEPVLVKLGHKPPFSETMITDILKEIDSLRKESDGKSKGKSGGSKRSFGSEFIKWFGRLDIEQTILLLVNFDFEKAYKLYSEVPASVVDRMIETKMGYEWTHAENNFEAVVYGMGGSFKGGSKDADKSFEEPKTQADQVARDEGLKSMGFM